MLDLAVTITLLGIIPIIGLLAYHAPFARIDGYMYRHNKKKRPFL